MNFSKPALSFSAQVTKLRARGLVVADEAAAQQFLSRVSYYRLSAYTRAFYVDEETDHKFSPGVTFEDVTRLYEFDRELRVLLLAAVERIEVALRAAATNHLCLTYGPQWFLAGQVFMPRFNVDEFLAQIQKALGQDPETGRRREQFLEHYFKRYTSPDTPPGWMVGEVLSFASWSKVFKGLADLRDQKAIAQPLGWAPPLIESWVHCLSILRNCCAHHSRVWNRHYAVRPTFPSKDSSFTDVVWLDTSFAAQAAVVHALMSKIAPADKWSEQLKRLFDRYPRAGPGAMGFKRNWHRHPFWGLAVQPSAPSGS